MRDKVKKRRIDMKPMMNSTLHGKVSVIAASICKGEQKNYLIHIHVNKHARH